METSQVHMRKQTNLEVSKNFWTRDESGVSWRCGEAKFLFFKRVRRGWVIRLQAEPPSDAHDSGLQAGLKLSWLLDQAMGGDD